ncbi:MAG: hypothetical protein AAFR16_00230 [Pseudomonadota bacterium]
MRTLSFAMGALVAAPLLVVSAGLNALFAIEWLGPGRLGVGLAVAFVAMEGVKAAAFARGWTWWPVGLLFMALSVSASLALMDGGRSRSAEARQQARIAEIDRELAATAHPGDAAFLQAEADAEGGRGHCGPVCAGLAAKAATARKLDALAAERAQLVANPPTLDIVTKLARQLSELTGKAEAWWLWALLALRVACIEVGSALSLRLFGLAGAVATNRPAGSARPGAAAPLSKAERGRQLLAEGATQARAAAILAAEGYGPTSQPWVSRNCRPH